jgi:hypothetical protein
MYGDKIPLGDTDAVSPMPELAGAFVARCDECGEERSHDPGEVLRVELNLPMTGATSAVRFDLSGSVLFKYLLREFVPR